MSKERVVYPNFKSPFCLDYWKSAVSELFKTKMIVVVAIITALRIILKSVSIPIFGNYVQITFGFFANALGSMIYGPIWGLLGGIVSDTIGAILFPSGLYFAPFMITESLSSFIFGLFLYKSKLSIPRVFLSKFSVSVICNLILTPIIMNWYFQFYSIEQTYKFFTVVRLMKNIALYPIESTLLVLFLGLMAKVTDRLGYTDSYSEDMKFSKKHIILLVILTVVSIGVFVLTYVWYINRK